MDFSIKFQWFLPKSAILTKIKLLNAKNFLAALYMQKLAKQDNISLCKL